MAELRKVRGARRELATLISAVVLMAVAMVVFLAMQRSDVQNQNWLALTASLSSSMNGVVENGQTALRGTMPDFSQLEAQSEAIDHTLRTLSQGDPAEDIDAAPAAAQTELAEVANSWSRMKAAIDTIFSGEQNWRMATAATQTIRTTIHADDGQDVFSRYEQIAERLGSRPGQNPAIQQLVRLERIASRAVLVFEGGTQTQANIQALDAEVRDFAQINQRLLADAQVASLAREVDQRFAAAMQASETLLENAEAVEQAQAAAGRLQGLALDVVDSSKILHQRLRKRQDSNLLLPIMAGGAGLLAIVLLIGFIIVNSRVSRQRLQAAETRDAKQQQAILSLLDEITNLADGDLTVDVTVTEDFTGAIADSINYTVQNMRNLVGTITQTSTEVASSASATKQTALHMTEASQRQAEQITAVAQAIDSTSQSMQQMAASAETLAEEAQQSVQIANRGAETVNRTIQGMTALREQIQDTSKRIKRLGESSQEIGNIIEFINDVAEQTNTLALNASIQAAMAGEAGRGFAIVADEVQRLSERAADATRQIETLVKTIQADTSEAIISMERSTQNVVGGAKSAEEAGQALTRIERASQELSRLIAEISHSARAESEQTINLSGTVQAIREIAVQTSGSATQAATQIGELNLLSQKLNESVSGFKLPEHHYGG